MADPKFIFHDHSLMETVREGNPEAQTFFRLLALCHTVMPEEKKEGERPGRCPSSAVCHTMVLSPHLCLRQESFSIRLSHRMKAPW